MKTFSFLLIIAFLGGDALPGNCGPPPDSKNNLKLNEIIEQVQMKNLKRTVSYLESYGTRSTWEKQWEAANWAHEQMRQSGLNPWMEYYHFEGKSWPNVFAKFLGEMNIPGAIFIIAHIDSVSDDPLAKAPGANDNGSGVAILMEIARILRGIPLERTVQFCIFTNEERGNVGSRVYAQKTKSDGIDIQAVINLDTLGYNGFGLGHLWQVFWARHSLKGKVESLRRLIRNIYYRFMEGPDIVKIGAKKGNENLLKDIASKIREFSGIKVKEIVLRDFE